MERQAPAVLKLLAHDLHWTLLQQLVHHLGQGQVQAFSAGNHPAKAVNLLITRAFVRWKARISQSVPKYLDPSVDQSLMLWIKH